MAVRDGQQAPVQPGVRPTLEAVAALAGVSRGTVSRVINDSPQVSARARAAVQAAIDQLGSAKNRSSDSDTTSATESVRWVTSVRAARFGTKPSFAMAARTASRARGLTCGESLMTRDTVPRETPASAATASRVGRTPVPGCGWDAGPPLRITTRPPPLAARTIMVLGADPREPIPVRPARPAAGPVRSAGHCRRTTGRCP